MYPDMGGKAIGAGANYLCGIPHRRLMRFDRKSPPVLCFQCLNCNKVFKGEGAEQKALDCCGSFIQGFYVNYKRWGFQKWYGR